MSNQRPKFDLPSPHLFEILLGLIGCIFYPFYFLTLFGVNLGPGDLLVVAVCVLYTLRTGYFTIAPDQHTSIGILGFLGMVTASLAWTPLPFEGFLQTLQYFLIFVVVIPTLIILFQSRNHRWLLFLAYVVLLGALIFVSAVDILVRNPGLTHYTFAGFGAQNTYYWTIAVGAILNGFLSLESNIDYRVRIVAAIIAMFGVIIVVAGLTLSAVLALGIGSWFFGFIFLKIRRGASALEGYAILSIICALVSLIIVGENWELIYQNGSLRARIPMYIEAATEGAAQFPIGHGIGSSAVALNDLPAFVSRSVHNFVLHYWLTIGVGVFAFTLIIWQWSRTILWITLHNADRLNPFEIAFGVVFLSYLVIAFFQPPPVRRFWWVFFAVSWAAVLDCDI